MNMPSRKYQSSIEANTAFMMKMEELVKEIVIQNNIPYYRIESRMEHQHSASGENIYMPVIRVVTYFEDSVSKISEVLSGEFDVQNERSKDKKKVRMDSFSYKHVQLSAALKSSRQELVEYRRSGSKPFEIHVCSMLQDAWAGIEKELGYDNATFPEEMKRDFYRVGALLEMADLEFLKIRSQLNSKYGWVEQAFLETPAEDVKVPEARTEAPVQLQAAPVVPVQPQPAPVNEVHLQTEQFVPQPVPVAQPAPAPQPVAVAQAVPQPAPVVPAAPVYQPEPVAQAPVQPVAMPQPAPVAHVPQPAPVQAAPVYQPEPVAQAPVYQAPQPAPAPVQPAAPVYITNEYIPQPQAVAPAPQVEIPAPVVPVPQPVAQYVPQPEPQRPVEQPVASQPVQPAPVHNTVPPVQAKPQEDIPFYNREPEPVAPAPVASEDAQMTDATLKQYIATSKVIKEIDSEIARRAGATLNSDVDIEGDVERLKYLKVYSLKQLHERVVDNKNDIIAFAEKWIGKDNGGSFDSGICLFYLEYLLVGKKNDPAFAVEYVLKFISDNDYSARFIIPTYNSISKNDKPIASHLTLK
jgi:hypothetical protein